MRAIVRKDLSQHGPLLLGGAGLGLVALIALVGARLLASGRVVLDADAVLAAYVDFVTWALTPYAVLIGRALALPELRAGLPTLRRLPVSLPAAFAAKALVGLCLLGAVAGCGLGMIASLLRLGGPLDRELFLALGQGSVSWLALVLALALVWASCGRLRHLALGGAALAWWASGGWGPPRALHSSGLLDPAAAEQVGWAAAAVAAGGLGLWAAYGRWGAGWCQGSLRQRERLIVVAAAVAVATQLARPAAPPGLAGRVVRVEQVTVRRLDDESRSQHVAARAAAVAAEVAQRTGLPAAPLAIEHGAGFGLRRERAVGLPAHGLLLRLDLEADLERPGLRGWWAGHLLDAASAGRLREAPWRALLDGYADWFEPPRSGDRAALRVAWSARRLDAEGLLGPPLLARWDEVRAALGDPLARAFAGWVLQQLAAESSAARVEALIAAVAQARARPRLGALTLRAQLVEHLGAPWDALAARLAARAREQVELHAARLDGVAAPTAGEVTPQPGAGGVRLAFRAPGRARLIHTLAATDAAPADYHGDEGDASAGPLVSHVDYPPGARLRVAFAAWSPELGCDLISGWRTLELP